MSKVKYGHVCYFRRMQIILLFNKIHLRSAQKLKNLFCKNGGAFIKVGQHIGGLDYLLPAEYVYTMKDLHNNAPESKVSELFETVETDFKCKVLEIIIILHLSEKIGFLTNISRSMIFSLKLKNAR